MKEDPKRPKRVFANVRRVKILVIGSSGSLGHALTEQLSQNHRVVGTFHQKPSFFRQADTVQLDVTSVEDFEKLDSDYDVVVMSAGLMPARMPGYNPASYFQVNTLGTLNVLEFMRRESVPKLVFITTFSDTHHKFYSGEPILNSEPRNLKLSGDHAAYAISKVSACDLIEHYHQDFGINSVIIRIPTIYTNDREFEYYVDGRIQTKSYVRMIRSIVNDKAVEIWGNPLNAKDMPYVKDFSSLVQSAVETKTAQGTFNGGTGHPISLEDLATTMIDVFGGGGEIRVVRRPELPSQPNYTFDMSETEKTLGHKPIWNVKNMLEDIRDTLGMESFKGL